MFSFARKLAATAMAMVMTVGVSATAMAEDQKPLQVQINGVNLELKDNAPIMKSNSIYVPFRAIFEGLGAEVSYDEATETVTAKRNAETLSFVVGAEELTLDKGGEKSVIKTTTPAFVEKNATYVPVRLMADTLGCTVNWDDAAQTAIIIDKVKLASDLAGKFTIADKYMAFNKEFAAKPLKFSGSLKYDINVTNGLGDGKDLPIALDGTLSGISESDKVNMKMAIKPDDATLKSLMAEIAKSALDAEATPEDTELGTKMITDVLNNLSLDLIMDVNTAKIFIKMPAIDIITEAEKATWYEFDLNAFYELAGMPSGTITQLFELNKAESFVDVILGITDVMPLKTSEEGLAFAAIIDAYMTFFSDEAFTKEADGYTTSYTQKEDGLDATVTMKLLEADEKITGYTMDMLMNMGADGSMKLVASQNGDVCKMSMDFDITDLIKMVFTTDMKYTETTDKALSKPSAGEAIVSLTDMLGATMIEADVAPATEATEAPADEAPSADAPATDAPAADAPAADAPAADAPAADAPAADAPATDAPAADAPATDVVPAA